MGWTRGYGYKKMTVTVSGMFLMTSIYLDNTPMILPSSSPTPADPHSSTSVLVMNEIMAMSFPLRFSHAFAPVVKVVAPLKLASDPVRTDRWDRCFPKILLELEDPMMERLLT